MKKTILSMALLGVLFTGCSNVNNAVQNNPIQNNQNIKDEKKTITFMDNATGLMWQDEPITEAEKTANDKNNNNGKVGNWNYAKSYCENLTLGGFSDWRLPNIYELATLLDNTKSSAPMVVDGIENIASNYYWSSTSSTSDTDKVWYIYFANGYENLGYNLGRSYISCVRGEQLKFDNLVILKNQGKLKVSQENIDKISPKEELKRMKEMEIYKQKKLAEQKEFEIAKQKEFEIAKQKKQKDKSAYDVASSINTINAYKEYIKKFPNGDYVQNARSEIEYLSPEKVAQRKREQAERERQAEYDRKHACDSFYPGKNFKVQTTGLFGGVQKARITGVDKESGQVSFDWYDDGLREWRSEETNCSYLKTQMR